MKESLGKAKVGETFSTEIEIFKDEMIYLIYETFEDIIVANEITDFAFVLDDFAHRKKKL